MEKKHIISLGGELASGKGSPLHPLTLRTPDIFLWMAFTTLIS